MAPQSSTILSAQHGQPIKKSARPPQNVTLTPEIRKDSERYETAEPPAAQAHASWSIGNSNQGDLDIFRFFVVTMIAISVFGASTFAVIMGEMTDPADIWAPESPTFTLKTVRLFLAMSWLAFAVSIAVAGYSGSFLALMQQKAGGEIDKHTMKKWAPAGLIVSAALHILIVTGFFFMSLSLVAYVGNFGWVIVSICSFMYFIVFYLLNAQYQAL